ncbi:hypothetical protein BDY19DRAFT_908649 [Irpex rosettiformis]|uniref:Uncharacterized protein n=1 Tax=Irpex rosettiformis TaxID=378272 RepID=A0ACB8TV23_9APHY|nr:hypothetical protein BDY19DRAFT_908649 [Irpex rosettiformis]
MFHLLTTRRLLLVLSLLLLLMFFDLESECLRLKGGLIWSSLDELVRCDGHGKVEDEERLERGRGDAAVLDSDGSADESAARGGRVFVRAKDRDESAEGGGSCDDWKSCWRWLMPEGEYWPDESMGLLGKEEGSRGCRPLLVPPPHSTTDTAQVRHERWLERYSTTPAKTDWQLPHTTTRSRPRMRLPWATLEGVPAETDCQPRRSRPSSPGPVINRSRPVTNFVHAATNTKKAVLPTLLKTYYLMNANLQIHIEPPVSGDYQF